MNYQLVIQIQGDSINDFESLVELEDALFDTVESCAEIDGHDFGSGQGNIFILTADPEETFRSIQDVLKIKGIISRCIIAYRTLSGEKYSVLWPEAYTGIFTVQ